jgi:hypothetical protein
MGLQLKWLRLFATFRSQNFIAQNKVVKVNLACILESTAREKFDTKSHFIWSDAQITQCDGNSRVK